MVTKLKKTQEGCFGDVIKNEIKYHCKDIPMKYILIAILLLLLILTPKLEEKCNVLLRNPSNKIMLEIVTWQFLLQLAQDNGWKPRGIKPIDYFSSDTTPMGTGYTPREAGLKCEIRNSDATGIGKAIYRAMLKRGLIKPKKTKLRDDGVITAVA